MGLLDIFGLGSTSDGTQAAGQDNMRLLGQAAGTAGQQLYSGSQNAQNTLGFYGNQAYGALGQGYGQARNDINGYTNAAQGQLNAGRDQANTYYNQGVNGFNPYTQAGSQATTAYSNALGLNGAAGNQAATAAFQSSPGYQYQVDQATDAAARKASSLGMGASGNTLTALSTLGSNLANQDYGNYMNRLQGLSGQGLSATGAQGSLLGQQGNLQYQQGAGQAGLLSNQGTQLGALGTGLGTAQAGISSNLGNSLGGIQFGTGQGLAGLTYGAATGQANQNMQVGNAADSSANATTNATLGLLGGAFNLATAPINPTSLLGGLTGGKK